MAERRKVAAELELEVSRYNRAGEEAAAVTRTVKAEIKGLGEAADGTGRDMDELAANTGLAKREVDGLGDKARVTAADLALLQSRIDSAKVSVRGLALEFARTGDAATSAKLSKERADLAKLVQAQKVLAPGGGGGLSSLLGSVPSIGGVPGPAVAAIGAGVAALSPFIGGVIAAAVLGGVGTGGVIGGILLAAQDARVKDAWKQSGHEIFADLRDAASPFVQPLTEAAHQFRDDWKQDAGVVRQIFADLAPTIKPLEQGVAGLLHELGPGLEKAAGASVPLATQFGKELTAMGRSSTKALDSIAAAEPGAELALHDLFMVIDVGVESLGDNVQALSDTYELLHTLSGAVPPEWMLRVASGNLITDYVKLLDSVGPQTSVRTFEATSAVGDFASQLDHARQNADALNLSLSKVFGGRLSADKAGLQATSGLLALKDTLRGNKGATSTKTAAGVEDRLAILGAIQDAQQWRDALREAGASAEDANRKYMDQIAAIKKIGEQAGITKKEMDKLAGPYEVAIFVTAKGNVPRGIKFTDTYALAGEFQNAPHRAAGGPVAAGRWYQVNEQRLEGYWRAPADGWVQPLASGASPMGGGAGIDYDQLAAALVGALRADPAPPIMLDGHVVSEVVGGHQASNLYARPRL